MCMILMYILATKLLFFILFSCCCCCSLFGIQIKLFRLFNSTKVKQFISDPDVPSYSAHRQQFKFIWTGTGPGKICFFRSLSRFGYCHVYHHRIVLVSFVYLLAKYKCCSQSLDNIESIKHTHIYTPISTHRIHNNNTYAEWNPPLNR